MNSGERINGGCVRLRLPATSANLGPGFDALAVALDFFLEIEAEPAAEFSIVVSGRDWERCARLENNLILDAYRELLRSQGREIVPLAIKMANEIPLGMGCGSSAAGRLAAIALANHFGQFGWNSDRIVDEAYRLEGHPDNVAACWLGGFVAAACEGEKVQVAQTDPPVEWRAIVALPKLPFATTKARAVLPATYPREDVVANIQSAALLGLAFGQGRGDLLRAAMSDRIHQPYRAPYCPLLMPMLPMVGQHGILGAALSGAGPAVLVVVDNQSNIPEALKAIRRAARDTQEIEFVTCRFLQMGSNRALEICSDTGWTRGVTQMRNNAL
jgi:homoserine kinase